MGAVPREEADPVWSEAMIRFPKAMGVEAVAQKPVRFTREIAGLSESEVQTIWAFHQGVRGYRPTPLRKLDTLAGRLGVAGLYVKDESFRFGLNAFKVLGGLYATARVICRELGLEIADTPFSALLKPEVRGKVRGMTLITATDGNHGNGIAWSASQLGCQSVVYMPKGSSGHRVQAIRRNGAQVTVTDLPYDGTVRLAAKTAAKNGWLLVQDTAWDGYTEIPAWITQGYTTMAAEALQQMVPFGESAPTHIFLQAGVGSMAAAIAGYFFNRFQDSRPQMAIVEPDTMACFYRSVCRGDGKPHAVEEASETIMAGLNCGQPSVAAWPVLRDIPSHFIACEDFVSARGMRFLGHPLGSDPQIVAGESGAVGAGLLTLLMEKPELAPLRDSMGLCAGSVILLFNTEGNTDPAMYDKIVFDGYCPSPG